MIEIYGYHGTTLDNAVKIVADQEFIDSNKDNEWLGTGVYFFAYKAHAEWWIGHERFQGKETRVLKAELKYREEQLLDLDNPAMQEIANSVLKSAITTANAKGEKLMSVDLDKLPSDKRCNIACNLVRFLCPEYGITSYTYTVKCKPGIMGFKQTQKQICVSDHSIIGKIEVCG